MGYAVLAPKSVVHPAGRCHYGAQWRQGSKRKKAQVTVVDLANIFPRRPLIFAEGIAPGNSKVSKDELRDNNHGSVQRHNKRNHHGIHSIPCGVKHHAGPPRQIGSCFIVMKLREITEIVVTPLVEEYKWYYQNIYPSFTSSSAMSKAPPAAPRIVLCDKQTNL